MKRRRVVRGTVRIAAPVAEAPADSLRQVLEELGGAKRRLAAAAETLRVVEGRVRTWSLTDAFQSRRGRALRVEAAGGFAAALDDLHALLQRLTGEPSTFVSGPARDRPPEIRRLIAAIRRELRYLQRAFDGGSLLLADALAAFGAREGVPPLTGSPRD